MDSISAGRPSYADDTVDRRLDLNRYLVKRPGSTFFLRVSGDSMIEAGIQDGDLLVVDRATQPTDESVVIVAIDGELAVKRLRLTNGKVSFESANPLFSSLHPTDPQSCIVWGVVSYVIHTL